MLDGGRRRGVNGSKAKRKSCLVCCCRRLVNVREVENDWFKKGRTPVRVEEDGCGWWMVDAMV
jgi:hypothetical protein